MKKRRKKERIYLFIVMTIILLIIIGAGIYIWYCRTVRLAPPEEGCLAIVENPGNDKVDIVFLTENVPQNKIEGYVKNFLASEPFASNKEKINFYYAGEGDCEIIEEKAAYCYSKELLKKSSVCPNDYIVVLTDLPAKIRSSAYLNVMSVNVNHDENVVLHEFGHVFANLADEYVPSVIPWGSQNCVKQCEDFSEYSDLDLEGCFEECSKGNYYRSSESSVMRSLVTGDFGELNEMLIEEELEGYE